MLAGLLGSMFAKPASQLLGDIGGGLIKGLSKGNIFSGENSVWGNIKQAFRDVLGNTKQENILEAVKPLVQTGMRYLDQIPQIQPYWQPIKQAEIFPSIWRQHSSTTWPTQNFQSMPSPRESSILKSHPSQDIFGGRLTSNSQMQRGSNMFTRLSTSPFQYSQRQDVFNKNMFSVPYQTEETVEMPRKYQPSSLFDRQVPMELEEEEEVPQPTKIFQTQPAFNITQNELRPKRGFAQQYEAPL